MKVLKFGGTSVGDADRIRGVVELVRRRVPAPMVLVFSAVGETTDRLLEAGRTACSENLPQALAALEEVDREHRALAEKLLPQGEPIGALLACFDDLFENLRAMAGGIGVLRDFSEPVRDRFLAHGELLSSRLLEACLRAGGVPASWVDAREVVVIDGASTQAEPLAEETRTRCRAVLSPLLESGRAPVVQGFIARSKEGLDTTLGRGGSDYTASLLGAALGAEEIEIWTDVDGIMTADPSLVPQARSIPVLSFQEAAELAFFGARVLHPKTLLPAVERGIPVRVLNTFRPDAPGTLVLREAPRGHGPVKSIAYKEGMSVVNLVSARMFKAPGFLLRVFEILKRGGLAPEVMATSEVSIAMAFSPGPALDGAVEELGRLGAVARRDGQALVCVVGDRLRESPGVVGEVLRGAEGARLSLFSQGGSEISFGFLVDEDELPSVIRRLHGLLFVSDSLAAASQETGARAFDG